MKSPRAATAGCLIWRKGGNCQAAEPVFSGQGCLCESHSAMIRKVKLSTENNILLKHAYFLKKTMTSLRKKKTFFEKKSAGEI